MRILLASLALLASACSVVGVGATADDEPVGEPVRVASGPDTETELLAHVLASLLRLEGLPVEMVSFAEARDSRQALELGAVDVRPGYTGETWLETMERPDPPGDPRESFVAVRDHDADRGIVWLRPRFGEGLGEPPANATFAFVVPPVVDDDLRTLSQLATLLSEQPDAPVCVDQEFFDRPDGLQAVLAAYGVRREREWLAADPEDAVLGVVAGDCLAGLTTATDGAAWHAQLRPVVDDLRVFPAFVVLPQVREEALDEQPRIRVAIGPMAAQLTTELLGGWNARVLAGEPTEVVAEDAAVELLTRTGRAVPSTEGEDG